MVWRFDDVAKLPPHLAERTRWENDPAGNPSGEFILYWMRNALRAHENPALDVAVTLANHCQLPLFVYQGLSERYRFASDRLHTFILQGAQDVSRQLAARGIGYAFHLERPGHRGPHLRTLAERATCVVTEDMPVEPLLSWTKRLGATLTTPLLCVDTACVAPLPLIGKAYVRAFEFRQGTAELYRGRVSRTWTDAQPDGTTFVPANLPFTPVDLLAADMAALVRQCEIGHVIGAVPHTPGGSAAGYRRWERFLQNGLPAYARRRNDPLADGTSRLSPYLHFGMVSPFRIARDAAAAGGTGGEKFLDELLIWRELAYAFCAFGPHHESLDALPAWARETLAEHASDTRAAIYSWETLARGRSEDPLWDAAQLSLLRHGELHNNVRMTWGKAMPHWTPDAAAALAMLIDLNHRYALDGRDPASYGGILWCLGQFDRPFPPTRPVLGTVRGRSTHDHARRLDVVQYRRHTTRPLYGPTPAVAIVGAGISGLICARTLADHGCEVTLFEKSRGVGGRMATRRADGDLQFDHGAQYFTARDPRFARYVDSWASDALVARWNGRVRTLRSGVMDFTREDAERFVAVPGMNAICRHLAEGLPLRLQTRVASLERTAASWHLRDDEGAALGQFDAVAISAPSPQAAALLAPVPLLARRAERAEMAGCWAALLAFQRPIELACDGAFVDDSPLAWIARNSSKRDRNRSPECWTLHASTEWTREHIDDPPEATLPALIDAFWQATGVTPSEPAYATAHRWRFALPVNPLVEPCLFDPDTLLGACGDWCGGPRVEGAFLSGAALAGCLLGQFAQTRPAADSAPAHRQQRLF